MSSKAIERVRIGAIATCVPQDELHNKCLALNKPLTEQEVDKVIDTTGVIKRFIANSKTCSSDLCISAAQELFKATGCSPDSIDIVIFVSQTPDYTLPATACTLQQRLGLRKSIAAFDINLGCSGYSYGLIVLSQMLSSGAFKKGLLLAGDTVSKFISDQDRSVAYLFGDAGSATLVEHDLTAPSMFFDCGTDGAGYDKLIVQAGAFRQPQTCENAERTLCDDGNIRAETDLFMSGPDIFTFTLKEVPKTITQVLSEADWSKDEVDYYFLHQANAFMLKHLQKKVGLLTEKVPMSLADFGNTSVASIPLTMCQTFANKPLSSFAKVVMSGFGVGFSWASLALILDQCKILPIITYRD